MALQDQTYVRRELEFPGALSQGANGAATKRVQEWLGYHGQGTPVDGKFGPATGRALAEFARRKQLGFSGALDEALWQALSEPLARIVALPAQAPAKPYAQAVRWLYAGSALLLLSYVGSRFVLQVLLGRAG